MTDCQAMLSLDALIIAHMAGVVVHSMIKTAGLRAGLARLSPLSCAGKLKKKRKIPHD